MMEHLVMVNFINHYGMMVNLIMVFQEIKIYLIHQHNLLVVVGVMVLSKMQQLVLLYQMLIGIMEHLIMVYLYREQQHQLFGVMVASTVVILLVMQLGLMVISMVVILLLFMDLVYHQLILLISHGKVVSLMVVYLEMELQEQIQLGIMVNLMMVYFKEKFGIVVYFIMVIFMVQEHIQLEIKSNYIIIHLHNRIVIMGFGQMGGLLIIKI